MIERRVEKTILDNGLVVLSEAMEHVCSIGLGIWIRAGSRHEEQPHQNGLSHFIEHALFKGTRRRSARQIAVEADIIGGNLDAFTTREFTGYYIKALDYHLAESFDILADLVTEPTFDKAEMEKERDVILEEIKMVDDTPDEMVHELFTATFWPNHPLGRPIEGTTKTVQGFTHDQLVSYFQQIYHPKNMVIAAAGHLRHDRIVELAAHYFGHLQSQQEQAIENPPQACTDIALRKKRGLEQTHIVLGAPCPSMLAPERYACSLFSTILGGGLSSRLFQSVREQHGLAYTIYSNINAFRDVGCLSIYLAVSNRRVHKAIELTIEEIRKLKEQPVPAEELRAAKDQIKAAILLNLDSVTSRMSSLAHNEMTYGYDFSLEEIISAIEQVSIEDIQRMGEIIFQPKTLVLASLGASDRLKLDREYLTC
ncbi:MAG: pitrilysin family protein [Acidobacteriota bacterium]